MNEDLEGALTAYITLMEEGAYFEAHEVLEAAWHPLRMRKDPLANLLKGLINGAIALEHFKRRRGAYRSKAKRVFCSYERHHRLCKEGIVYYPLFQKACNLLEEVYYISSDKMMH